jgi:hypothetical protein
MHKILLFLSFFSAVFSKELLINGDFATGDFTGWKVEHQNQNGTWYIYQGSTTPSSHIPFYSPPTPYAAITDENDPSSMVLYQDVVLPSHSKNILSYQFAYLNHARSFAQASSLNSDGPPPENQQLRIDLMKVNSDPFSVDPQDILQTFFTTPTGFEPFEQGYVFVAFDISQFAGQDVRIRFANANNLNGLFLGIANVSIQSYGFLSEAIRHFSPIKLQQGL